MRVLLMVTNAVFLVAVAQAGHKRVIIRVPQRIKHIYHHQVKKVPVYVVLPQKKSKVLDDLEEVTKVLPCREGDREPQQPWQDDIAVAAPPPSRYRYAKSYRDHQTSDSVYLSDGDTTISNAWQQEQDVKRWLQPPPPPPPPPSKPYRSANQRKLSSATATAATIAHNSASASLPTWTTTTSSSYFDDDMTAAAVISSSTLTLGGAHQPGQDQSQRQRHRYDHDYDYDYDRNGSDRNRNRNRNRDRIRYARHYAYENGNYYDTPSKATSLSADILHVDDGSNEPHKWPSVERGGGDVNDNAVPAIDENFVRISYPPEPAAAADSFFYNSGGDSGAASASGAQFQSDHNRQRQQQQQQHQHQQPPSSFHPNNYASSYQYKIQH